MNEVILNPIVDDEPCYDENELKYTEVCPVCVVATVMRMKPREEETLLQDGSTETRDVELKHILFAHVNDHLLYGDDDISRFSTYTDHQRLTRWGLILQAYNLIIKHIKATISS